MAQWHTLLLLYLRLTFLFPVTFCQAIIFMMRMTEARKAIVDCGIQQRTDFKGKTLYEKQKQRELSKKSQSSYVKGDEIEVEVVGWSEKEVPKASVGLANEGSTREEQNVHFIDPPKKFAEGTTGVDDPEVELAETPVKALIQRYNTISKYPDTENLKNTDTRTKKKTTTVSIKHEATKDKGRATGKDKLMQKGVQKKTRIEKNMAKASFQAVNITKLLSFQLNKFLNISQKEDTDKKSVELPAEMVALEEPIYSAVPCRVWEEETEPRPMSMALRKERWL